MSDKSGLKLVFETPKGERVERILKANWSSDCCLDLKAFHSDQIGEDFKQLMAGMIAEAITLDLIKDMLTELEQKAK